MNLKKKKKNELLPFTAMQMDLENIMLSEISQTEKEKYFMIQKIIQENVYANQKKTQIQKANLWLIKRRGRQGGIK